MAGSANRLLPKITGLGDHRALSGTSSIAQRDLESVDDDPCGGLSPCFDVPDHIRDRWNEVPTENMNLVRLQRRETPFFGLVPQLHQ